MSYPLGQDPGGKSQIVPSRLATRHQVRAQKQTKLMQPVPMVRPCQYEYDSSTLLYNSVVVKLKVEQHRVPFTVRRTTVVDIMACMPAGVLLIILSSQLQYRIVP